VQRQPALYGTVAFGGGDKAHLQDLEDQPLDSVSSLIALMEAVGPRKMKWEPFEMTPTSYKCDLGLGGAKYLVGTALDIWVTDSNDSHWAQLLSKNDSKGKKKTLPKFKLTKDDLIKALSVKANTTPSFSFDAYLGMREGAHRKGPLTTNDISDADMKKVHSIIRGEFEAAAANWKKWKPVLYPGSDRRPKAKH
jgi:hypothetical protein